jgi:hypothetical protein
VLSHVVSVSLAAAPRAPFSTHVPVSSSLRSFVTGFLVTSKTASTNVTWFVSRLSSMRGTDGFALFRAR